jgi:hypothetical protein
VTAGEQIQLKQAPERADEYSSPRMEGYEVAQGKKAWKPGWLLGWGGGLVSGWVGGWVMGRGWGGRGRGGLPVRDAWHDFGFDVGLDDGPGLAFLRGRGGEEIAEVAW